MDCFIIFHLKNKQYETILGNNMHEKNSQNLSDTSTFFLLRNKYLNKKKLEQEGNMIYTIDYSNLDNIRDAASAFIRYEV